MTALAIGIGILALVVLGLVLLVAGLALAVVLGVDLRPVLG